MSYGSNVQTFIVLEYAISFDILLTMYQILHTHKAEVQWCVSIN